MHIIGLSTTVFVLQTLAHLNSIITGNFAQTLFDFRTELNIEPHVWFKLPLVALQPYRVSTFAGVLTTAVTWWPLSSACFTISFPVSPVPPKTTSFNGFKPLPSSAILDLYWCVRPGIEGDISSIIHASNIGSDVNCVRSVQKLRWTRFDWVDHLRNMVTDYTMRPRQ